jgi:hypothetical protein
MTKFMNKAGLATMIAATLLAAGAPAEAQRRQGWNNNNRDWSHNRRHRGNDKAAAGAVLGGILGLGIGAAIVSSANDRNRDRDRRYDRYRDDDRGYYARPSDRDPWGTPSGYAAGGVVSDGRGYDPYRR